jgi:hypothetical protein
MSIKDKILRGTDANLHASFDVGHSSIGWGVLEKTGQQVSDIKINGCGSVVFRADDCLASSRRAYRRQRRHTPAVLSRLSDAASQLLVRCRGGAFELLCARADVSCEAGEPIWTARVFPDA